MVRELLIIGLLAGCGGMKQGAPETEALAPSEAAAPAEAAATSEWKHFGAPYELEEALPASVVLKNPEAHASGPVRVRGELTQVCQKMGCWAVMADSEGHAVRVLMKDHAFGIDKDTLGHECDVEGTLVRKKVDPEALEHYASEGATEHPEAGREEAWELVSTAVSTRSRG